MAFRVELTPNRRKLECSSLSVALILVYYLQARLEPTRVKPIKGFHIMSKQPCFSRKY